MKQGKRTSKQGDDTRIGSVLRVNKIMERIPQERKKKRLIQEEKENLLSRRLSSLALRLDAWPRT
jgi:hypothetical protein